MKIKVHLMGGDSVGWALDQDLSLTRTALESVVEWSTLTECDVIHSVWWEPLLSLPEKILQQKTIICHLSGSPFRYLGLPRFAPVLECVDHWISQSTQGQEQADSVGIHSCLVPYALDFNIFHPLQESDSSVIALKRKWRIPEGKYLIGNFHRDTEGHDLESPKLVKGPDLFYEIIVALHQKKIPVHVVLAGPRRFWIRKKLKESNIPYTFVGDITVDDDIHKNNISLSTINTLYNIIDCYIISSRSEGGPRSLLEAVSAKCKVISTDVGLARDLLDDKAIFSDFVDAVSIIESDFHKNYTIDIQCPFDRVSKTHSCRGNGILFKQLYEEIDKLPSSRDRFRLPVRKKEKSGMISRGYQRLLDSFYGDSLRISLFHDFVKPPFGGGNQFMMALRKSLLEKKVPVFDNSTKKNITVYILNAIRFDQIKIRAVLKDTRTRVIHRVDGPISLIRGKDRHLDDLCFEMNNEFADATVLQSAWTFQRVVELGYNPVRPVIIKNSVDPEIFNNKGKVPFSLNRKIRLISSSWSDNPRKGGGVYKWIEDNLDWERYSYTFVGRASVEFKKINQVPPVNSEGLATYLKGHDIYITASQNDPCSNAVIEALACGLPVLFLNDGGHPELVGFGGLPFNNVEEIFPQLEKLVAHYSVFQNLISVPTLDHIADQYLQVARMVMQS
jgi:glycosyltransferase involved in cell wall biosynthesis